MRAVALHEDVIVFVSDVWQTSCTAVRGADEGFVIDSVVYPEELRALPDVLEQAGFPVSGLLTTHGDWDHLLGRLAYPGAALGGAESTVARIGAEVGEAQRKLRAFDESHYVPERGALSLGSLQALPVPGRLEIGTRPPEGPGGPEGLGGPEGPPDGGAGSSHELEMLPAEGHTSDGAAYWLPWAKVLVCGDYLSPVEIPMLSASGSLAAYRATLGRLSGFVAQAQWIVPGHGAPLDRARAEEVMGEDDQYLAELERDPGAAQLPATRHYGATQQGIHAANIAHVSGA